MLDYGDNRDSLYLQVQRYHSELNVTRQYAGQKEWPRAVWVRKARLHHTARLHWNSVERVRNLLEDQLIDEVTEWSLWHYATGKFQTMTSDRLHVLNFLKLESMYFQSQRCGLSLTVMHLQGESEPVAGFMRGTSPLQRSFQAASN